MVFWLTLGIFFVEYIHNIFQIFSRIFSYGIIGLPSEYSMSSTSSSTTLVPPSPPLHSPSNTKQINTMKSECCQIFATCCYIPGVCAGVPGQCRITVLVWNVLSKYDFIVTLTSMMLQSFSFLGLWVCSTIHTFSEADFMT